MPPELVVTVSSSTLAFVSTLHLTLLVLRQQRSVKSLGAVTVLLPSLAFSALPWFMPAPVWLVSGVIVHLAWFVACEKLAPPPAKPQRAGAAKRSPAPAAAAAEAPAASEPRPAPAAPPSFQPVPVLAVFEESEDIKTFRMLRPEGFDFAAGQFVTIRLQAEGKPLVRCYSISSAPEAAGYLEISVKRQGVVSGMLHATVRPGSMLAIKRPNGKFTYPDGDDRPIVCLAGGVGITPLVSMFRHALAAEPMRPATLIISAKDERQVAFRHELDFLTERHPQGKVVIVTSGGPFALMGAGGGSAIARFSGRINEALLRKVVPDITNSIYMICGPAAMMNAMRELLASIGVPAPQIRYEAFEAAVAMSKEDSPAAAPKRAPAKAAAAQPAAAPAGGGLRLVLRQSGVTVDVGPQQTLLEAAEAGGVEIASSCRAGVCMTCRTCLVEGEVDCDADSLDEDDRANGFILPCVAYAKGNCVLDV